MPVTGVSGCAGRAGELSCSLGLQSEVTVHSFAENLVGGFCAALSLRKSRSAGVSSVLC